MAMLADSTVAVGGNNDESDCYIGKKKKKRKETKQNTSTMYFGIHLQLVVFQLGFALEIVILCYV